MAAYKAELDKHPFGHKVQDLGNVLATVDVASCHHHIRSLPCHKLHLKHLDKSLDSRSHSHWRLHWHSDAYGGASDAHRLHDVQNVLRNKLALDTQDNMAALGMDTASCDGDNMAGLGSKDLTLVKLAMLAPFAADTDTLPACNDHDHNKDHMRHDAGDGDDAPYSQPFPLPLRLLHSAFAGN